MPVGGETVYSGELSGQSGTGCRCDCFPTISGCCPDDLITPSRYHLRLDRIRNENFDCHIDFTPTNPELTLDGYGPGFCVDGDPFAEALICLPTKATAFVPVELVSDCGTLHITDFHAFLDCGGFCNIDNPGSATLIVYFSTFPPGFTPNGSCPSCPAGIPGRISIAVPVGCSDPCDIDSLLGSYEVVFGPDVDFPTVYRLNFTFYKI